MIAAGERLPAIAFTEGYQTGYFVAATVALVGAIVVLALLPGRKAQPAGGRVEPEAQPAPLAT